MIQNRTETLVIFTLQLRYYNTRTISLAGLLACCAISSGSGLLWLQGFWPLCPLAFCPLAFCRRAVEHSIIDGAIDQWRRRHSTREGYFEYRLWQKVVETFLTISKTRLWSYDRIWRYRNETYYYYYY